MPALAACTATDSYFDPETREYPHGFPVDPDPDRYKLTGGCEPGVTKPKLVQDSEAFVLLVAIIGTAFAMNPFSFLKTCFEKSQSRFLRHKKGDRRLDLQRKSNLKANEELSERYFSVKQAIRDLEDLSKVRPRVERPDPENPGGATPVLNNVRNNSNSLTLVSGDRDGSAQSRKKTLDRGEDLKARGDLKEGSAQSRKKTLDRGEDLKARGDLKEGSAQSHKNSPGSSRVVPHSGPSGSSVSRLDPYTQYKLDPYSQFRPQYKLVHIEKDEVADLATVIQSGLGYTVDRPRGFTVQEV